MNATSLFSGILLLLIGLILVVACYGMVKVAIMIVSSLFADTFDAKHRYKVFSICEQQLNIAINGARDRAFEKAALYDALLRLRTMHKEARPADDMIVHLIQSTRMIAHGHPQG